MKRTVKAGESLRLAGRFHRGDEQSGRIIQILAEKTRTFCEIQNSGERLWQHTLMFVQAVILNSVF
jgi:hypothetical protein